MAKIPEVVRFNKIGQKDLVYGEAPAPTKRGISSVHIYQAQSEQGMVISMECSCNTAY